jgi:hypothetical protein
MLTSDNLLCLLCVFRGFRALKGAPHLPAQAGNTLIAQRIHGRPMLTLDKLFCAFSVYSVLSVCKKVLAHLACASREYTDRTEKSRKIYANIEQFFCAFSPYRSRVLGIGGVFRLQKGVHTEYTDRTENTRKT